jgi:hypothetical protein
MADKRIPDPGSKQAVEKGCKCPVIDNCHGKGRMGDGERNGWWINADCELHNGEGGE